MLIQGYTDEQDGVPAYSRPWHHIRKKQSSDTGRNVMRKQRRPVIETKPRQCHLQEMSRTGKPTETDRGPVGLAGSWGIRSES